MKPFSYSSMYAIYFVAYLFISVYPTHLEWCTLPHSCAGLKVYLMLNLVTATIYGAYIAQRDKLLENREKEWEHNLKLEL